MNFGKSAIAFSHNIDTYTIASISNCLGVTRNIGNGNYLGLPSLVDRSKKAIFNFIKDRIWKKCQAWSARSLSRAGKEVLIKSVAQAIPSYCMGVILIPSSLCEEIERMMNSFYWGSKKNGTRSINWMRWEKLTIHKSMGGLGFRNMEAFNLFMLGKQGWKLLKDPSSLLTCILKAKYFPKWNFLEANISHNPSYTWRSIWSSDNLSKLGYRWKIGDGTQINVWTAPWIRTLSGLKPSTPPLPNTEDVIVCDLLNPDLLSWNFAVIHNLFSTQEATAILNIPLHVCNLADARVWQYSVDGVYTVKTTYRRCMSLAAEADLQSAEPHRIWNMIWKQQISHKVRVFLWWLAHTCLLTRTNLIHKGVPCTDARVSCDIMVETHTLAFFVCPKASSCWELAQMDSTIRVLLHNVDDFTTLLFTLFDRLSDQQQSLASMILWSIWKSRNSKLWEGSDTSPSIIVQRAKDLLNKWSYMQRARHLVSDTQQEATWSKPPASIVKCNVDCALFNNNTITGYGCCICDFSGQLLLGMSNYAPFSSSPTEAKALGLLEAIKIAITHGYQSVLF